MKRYETKQVPPGTPRCGWALVAFAACAALGALGAADPVDAALGR